MDKSQKHSKFNIRVGGTVTVALKGNALFGTSSVTCEQRGFISAASVTELTCVSEPKGRRYIPTEKQLVDPFRQGVIIKGVGYRQTVVTYKETALNHVWVSELLGDGFGATHGMERNNLAWVVTGMQVRVDEYPVCEDWLIRRDATGDVLARATRTWAMMNQQTRCLSKMPEAVRAEISPGFIEKKTLQEEIPEKINKLNTNAKFTNSNLKVTRIALECRKEWAVQTWFNYYVNLKKRFLKDIKAAVTLTMEIHEHQLNSLKTYTHLLQITGEKESGEIVRGEL
ncbi:hypothetical protein POTOM_050307 [Populus tomentosa]|uniref:Uncharacterized protein n=1 Tax=Populus tomentosa TaxID=118781 RepID=A0A8X7Y3X4_POPTO|nr:hypothetical protein POTOM_050307 [Populus tomentosa]